MLIDINYLFSKYNIKPDGILHLGANSGQEADSYQALGVKRVFWIEAVPHKYVELCRHIQRFTGNVCYHACIGEEQGKEVTFNISNNDAQSSSYLPLGTHKVLHPEVEYIGSFPAIITRIDNMFDHDDFPGTWLLNMDLQGAELPAVRGIGTIIDHFDWVYTEINTKEVYEGCTLLPDLDAYLDEKGFYRAETSALTGDSWGDALYIRNSDK